jgi:hypothetical protein
VFLSRRVFYPVLIFSVAPKLFLSIFFARSLEKTPSKSVAIGSDESFPLSLSLIALCINIMAPAVPTNSPPSGVDLEIVGLLSNSNGRSCTEHTVCGQTVEVGDVLRLVKTVVTVNGVSEEAVKCVRISEGVDCCTVAFLPRLLHNLEIVKKNINNFVVVKEIYGDSDNTYKRRKSSKNFGMAGVVVLSEIPQAE